MGILEKWTHSEEIKELRDKAKECYESAQQKMEEQREKTSKSFEQLGQRKLDSWSRDVDLFLNEFQSFNTVDVVNIEGAAFEHITEADESQMIINMQQGSLTAKEIVKAGAASLGAGALVGIASYGGVMMFGHASTGTAIAALSGVAKTNATLAWFGGGAKAVGGLGKVGGSLVLAGIVVLPILAVSSVISVFTAKAKLAEAKKLYAEACEASEKMKVITSGMKAMKNMSDEYTSFIAKLSVKFQPYITAIKRIKKAHNIYEGERISFDDLTPIEQRTLHVSWLLAQVYYQVLATPILTDNGETSVEAAEVLHMSREKLDEIIEKTNRTGDECTMIGDIVDEIKTKRMMTINILLMIALIILSVLSYQDNRRASLMYAVSAAIAGPLAFIIKRKSAKQSFILRVILLALSVILAVIAYTML